MKHKKLTTIVALVLVAALAAGLGIWATGEANIPTVTYYDGSDGTNAHFTFTHTGKGSDTNLFPNFSDCMPGDSLTQTIRVQADSKNGAQGAKIYLRAEIDGDASAKEGSAISYNDVLDHISMTVSKNGVVLASNKTAKLFSQLDASEGLKSNVFIAEVSPKTDPVDLDVTIDVDPAMGNAFQEAAAHITFVFSVEDNELNFHDIPLMELIKQYGTPLKITYLPKISQQINRAKRMFNVAMAKVDYKGSYNYCYCTKSSHFSFVLEEAMKNDVHLETSSAYDIHIINALYDGGIIDKDRYIICNGFKRPQYVENIAQLVNDGFVNTIPVLDNKEELDLFEDAFTKKCKVGIRIACEEEPKFEFYTSRLGIRYNDILDFYKAKLKNSKKFQLKMLHFFINTGIKDTAYYWNELSKCMNVYCELKAICPELDSLNIGGGFPIKNSLNFEYDYEYLTEEIVAQIKNICQRNGVEEPNIFTEFGSFTVGESGAVLYSIVNQKQQNDRENWYMIDSSFITTLPDTWGINQRYIMLAVNNWDREYQRVLLGGLTCDSEDFYNAESHTNAIFLPKLEPGNTQYIGFFHTGAYQESLGGFGGIQHCLIPAPKHIIIDRDKSDNEYYTRLFAKEQSYRSMLRILGY